MKKNVKLSIGLGIILMTLMTMVAYASEVYDVSKISGYDFADIYLNGVLSLEKEKGYQRSEDGLVIPSSLNWEGTTYVPLRLMSEILGAEVGWDGSILIDLDNGGSQASTSNYSKRVLDKQILPYSNTMYFAIKNGKTAYVEDGKGTIVYDLDLSLDPVKGVTISNPYMLSLDENFTLTVVKEEEIVEQPFYVGDVTLDSFEEKNGQWYTVIPANPDSGFYHPAIIGFRAVTRNIEKDFAILEKTLIVEGSNEGVSFTNKDSYAKQINERFTGELSVLIAERNQLPFMVSMFPRPMQDTFLYSHALDRDTLFNTQAYMDSLGRGNLYRMDEQFLAMSDAAKDIFGQLGLSVEDKVAIAGFSASSDWANRLTMLHPERIKYLIANITATMPMSTYEGHDLPYPLGLSNIDEVTGSQFDADTYRSVPMFWFVGAEDAGDGTRYDDGWGNYGSRKNEWNQEGIDYRAIFGQDSIKRRSLQMSIIEGLGFDKIDYIAYEGLEHDWGDNQLNDIDAFIQRVK